MVLTKRTEMTALVESPCEIRVGTNIRGVPLGLTRNGRRERVAAIYEHWQSAEEARGNKPERDYFRIKTNQGLVCDIYRDMRVNRWYLSKIHCR